MFADVIKELCIVWSCRENVERFEGRSETYGGSDAVIDLRFSNFCYSPFCASANPVIVDFRCVGQGFRIDLTT